MLLSGVDPNGSVFATDTRANHRAGMISYDSLVTARELWTLGRFMDQIW